MALLSKVKEDRLVEASCCFYCGEVISDDGVTWIGYSGFDLTLHEQCCLNLVVRLFRDIHELQIARGGTKCH